VSTEPAPPAERPDAAPPAPPGRGGRSARTLLRRFGLLVGAIAAAVALVVVYLALGGGTFEPTATADPCAERDAPDAPNGATDAAAVAQRIVLVALDRTACRLGTSREALALALVNPQGVDGLLDTGRTQEEIDDALREGVLEAVGEAETAGVLQGSLAEFLRGAADVLPVAQVVRWATDDAPPCDPVEWGDAGNDMGRVTARIALDGVARAACALKVPVADVVVAAGSTDTLGALAQQAGVPREQVEAAVRQGVLDAVDAADQAGALDADTADVVKAVVNIVPVDRVIGTIRGDISACEPLPWQPGGDTMNNAAQIGVHAALASACALDVPIEELLIDLSSPNGVQALADRSGKSVDEVEAIVRDATRKAIDEAQTNGAFSGTIANAVKAVVDVVPLDRLFATVRGEDVSCLEPTWRPTDSTTQLAAEIALIGIAKAACTLQKPIFDVAGALASSQALDAYAQAEGLSRDQIEEAVRNGLKDGLKVAQDNGAFGSVTGFLLDQVVDNAPILDVLQLIENQL
jgi:hypothetical protein